jgi:hypothetical protein
VRLDAQNDRILEQLRFIRKIGHEHRAAIAELATFVASREFLELLASGYTQGQFAMGSDTEQKGQA